MVDEDPQKVFGARDCYEPSGTTLRVTQGHTGRDGEPLMIFGIGGMTVRLRPESVVMLGAFIGDYLGMNSLPSKDPQWYWVADPSGDYLARADGRVRVVARVLMPGNPAKWTAQRVVDRKGDALLRDTKKRIRYFPTTEEATQFADQYAPMGVTERGVTAVEIVPAIHILWEGLSLCRFTHKVPGEWPEGHTWVSKTQVKAAPEDKLCEHCVEELDE